MTFPYSHKKCAFSRKGHSVVSLPDLKVLMKPVCIDFCYTINKTFRKGSTQKDEVGSTCKSRMDDPDN